MKLILTDVDECLLKWHEGFSNWIKQQKLYSPYGELQNYLNIESWLEIDSDIVRNLVNEFNSNENTFSDIKPYHHAIEYLPKLHDLGYKFIAVSACANNEWTHKTRLENIVRYFPNMFLGLHCCGNIGTYADKFPFLNLYKPAIWVDDHFKHADAGVKAGHTTFMLNYTHNSIFDAKNIIRVNDWQDIYKYIKDL